MEGELGILAPGYLTPYSACVTHMPHHLLIEVDMEKRGSLWELYLLVWMRKKSVRELVSYSLFWMNEWLVEKFWKRMIVEDEQMVYFGSGKFNHARHSAKINMLPTPWVKIFDEIIIFVSCLLPFQMSPLQCEKSFHIYPLITLNFSPKLRWWSVLLLKPLWVSRTHFKLSHSTVISLRGGHS